MAAPTINPNHRVRLAIMGVMSAVYFFAFFQRVAVPGTIFDELQAAFRITAAGVAGLGAIYLYIYAAMQLPAGVMCDRWGAARVFLAGALILSIGSLGFPAAPTLGWLYAARALVGLGSSLIFLSVIKALDRLFTHAEFSRFMGIVLFVGYAGGLFGTLPFERTVSLTGWRPSLFVAGLICAIVTLTGWMLISGTPRLRSDTYPRSTFRLLWTVIRNRRNVPLLIVNPINFAIYFTVQATIGKKMLSDHLGVGTDAAALLTFGMMLVTMCMATFGGFLTHWIGDRRKPLLVVGPVCVLTGELLILAALGQGLGLPWFFAAYLIMACSALNMTSGIALIKETNPPEAVGIAVGLLNSTSYLAVALATSAVGFGMDLFKAEATEAAGAWLYPTAAYRLVFRICVGLSLLVVVVAVCFLRESHATRALYRQIERR